MAIGPVYCPEDPGGPLSKDEALKLIESMRQRAIKAWGDNADADSGNEATFHHASGQEQALAFAADLIGRIVLDPNDVRRVLLGVSHYLEDRAAEFRRRAQLPGTED